MPSNKKRINLTVSESLYEQIQAYKNENGIDSDATACLQLVAKAIQSYETSKAMLSLLNTLSPDELKTISNEGWDAFAQYRQDSESKK